MSTALICGLVQGQAWADPASPEAVAAAAADPSQIAPTDRDKVLGKGWKVSTDRAWTTSGDAAGFHVLVADQKAGYGWRTAATLAEPGFDADMWIGNACVTGSGKRAVVAYAPRTFTNKPELMARGAFTAVVDLDTGAVTKLDRQASLAYFSPGCGIGETAVLTQAGGETKNQTRLLTVDVAAAKVSQTVEVAGQVTSAIPVGNDIVAADAARLTRIDEQGRRTAIAQTAQVPFGLKVDTEGSLVYMDRPAGTKDQGEVKRITARDIARGDASKTKQTLLARGALTKMDLSSSADGTVFITGDTQAAQPLPKTVQRRPDVPKDSTASTSGKALVTNVTMDENDPRKQQDLAAESKKISLKVLATGKEANFTVTPTVPDGKATAGIAPSPALPGPRTATLSAQKSAAQPAAMAASTVENERYCSVARNDPAKQAMQPKPRQVEWAVDQIVNGTLDKNVSRPANWKNLGMAEYQPQTLFPRLGLNGGGRIPAQVLLGITAQESNMWQASRVVVPGVTGNPLIGNYYGIKYAASGQQTDPWAINWSEADCGYGVTQITDGMRMHGKEKPGEQPLTTLQQEAAALDYTANIAAGQRVLADKWNVTNADGLKVNNGDPKYLENWFFALWAYNSGYYPKAAAATNGGLWGVGFTNNPANPLWKANRNPFLEGPAGVNDYSHAKHPQDWPYQEKVLGWAARPLEALESPGKMVAGFREAWWTSTALRSTVKPAENLFCTAANSCDPSKIGPNDQNEPGLGACTRADLKCWWNQPVTWKDCTTKAECGNELMRFNDTYKEEADGTAYPPNCTTQGLPANAIIVDDVPDGTPIHRPGCSSPKPNSGTFNLDFATPSAKIDLHQLGAGYTSHFWFAHARKDDATGQRLKVTGTWKLSQKITEQGGQAKVFVHIPDHGAQTLEALYDITTTSGVTTKRISQSSNASNKWVDLGAYWFTDMYPQVSLSNFTADGTGDDDIAWDAIAFVPGDYSGIPSDLTFGDPDVNAPEPAPVEPYATIPGDFFNELTAGNTFAKSAPTSEKVTAARLSASDVRSSATTAPGSDTASCSITQKSMIYKRTHACIVAELVMTQRQLGRATFRYRHEIDLDVKSDTFTQTATISLLGMEGGVTNASLNVAFDCSGTCQMEPASWSGSTDFVKGDVHTAIVTHKTKWTKGAGFSVIAPNWTYSGVLNGRATNSLKAQKSELDVRCDVDVSTTPGCVFKNYVPGYGINHKKFPAAAAHAWLAQNKLPGKYGLRGGTPLTFLADDVLVPVPSNSNKALVAHNRDTICPDSWERSQSATLSPELATSRNDTYSCDEFPFASSWQSAAIPKAWYGKNLNPLILGQKGDSCATTIAVRENGVWRMKPDPRANVPTWTEPCARASMSGNQNSQSMALFPTFRRDNRLLEGDQYWLDVQKP
ncbi:golvesin C-terminal-like domain-containing protein [Streptomyces goshikiensis]